MPDGSRVKFRKLAKDYDPTDHDAATRMRKHQQMGEVVTGLLYVSADSKDVHDQNDTVPGSLNTCRTPSSALPGQGRAAEADAAVPIAL